MLLRPRGELASFRSERTARENRRGSHLPRTPSGLPAENLPRGRDSGGKKAKPGVCVCIFWGGGGRDRKGDAPRKHAQKEPRPPPCPAQSIQPQADHFSRFTNYLNNCYPPHGDTWDEKAVSI